MNRIRNVRTIEGAEAGRRMASYCDEAEPKARLLFPEIPPRCSSCAFRLGPHLANGSPATQLDALKCVIEGEAFYCHQHDRDGEVCSGWAMCILGFDYPGKFGAAWWEFCGGEEV
jgi:hypothetical protein